MIDWNYVGYCTVVAMFVATMARPALVGIRAICRLPRSSRVAFVSAAVVACVIAQKTNNVPPNLNMPLPQTQQGEASFQTGFTGLTGFVGEGNLVNLVNPVQTTSEDVARGWRVESVTTNTAVSYAMPTNAATVGNWHVHGAASSFGNNRIDFGDFAFPIGTNNAAFSTFWYFIDGRIRPAPRDVAREICAVGAPMSAVPGQSRLWTAEEPDGCRVVTWESFFLGGDTNCPVNAQIRLYANGDFTTRSNDVETVCRRINPDDWDDDGIPNDMDADPMSCDGDFFGPANVLPEGANSNAYCTVSLVATGPDALITFTGDKPSNYPDPQFVAKSGATNEVVILVGKTYTISSDWPFDVVGVSDPETEVWTVRGATHQVHVRRPVEIAASRGNPFMMSVVPASLGGVFAWQSSTCSCSMSGSGSSFSWNCSADCTCCGSSVEGTYSYEGYWLPATSGVCSCHYDEDHPGPSWEESTGPAAASVSATFSKSAVIFEDPYENEPGQLGVCNPTRTRLNIVANGGPNGAMLSVSSANLAKLTRLSGPDLPVSVSVPAEMQVTYSLVYEGSVASAVADDITVTAIVTDADNGDAVTNDCATTSIRLELAPVWEAPENPCTNRHVYGVGERVRIQTFPESVATSVNLTRIDASESPLYDNMISSAEKIYACPIYSVTPNLKVVCREAEYRPAMTIVEPQEVVTRGVGWDTYNAPCLSPGLVGGAVMVITNYVGPMKVSFHGIMVSEIPCTHTNMPSGFFATANYTGQWTHKRIFDDGWGMATRIGMDNYWTVDHAGHSDIYDNWSAGRLVWDIPIGWVRMRFDGDDRHGVREEEHEINSTEPEENTSRPLLIGGSEDAYQQIFSISENGTATIEKHGHAMSRGRFCRIVIDGKTIQWTHGL